MSNVPRLLTVDRLNCILEPHAWDFAALRADDIQSHWRDKTSVNPSLYDGRVLLARRVAQSGDAEGDRTLSIDFFETGFSNFLAWQDFGFPDTKIYNCFAMAALRSRDGAYLLGEMGSGHSNAGAIYFPGGTPDLLDVRGDFVDLEGSAARELLEETGLSLRGAELEPGWTIVFDRQYVACLKTISSPEPAEVLIARAQAHLAQEEDPELAAIYMVSRRADLSHPKLRRFVRAFLEPLLPD